MTGGTGSNLGIVGSKRLCIRRMNAGLCAGRCAQVLPAETRPVGRDLRRTGKCQWLYRERAKIVHDDSRCKHDFVYMENVNKNTSKCG